MKLMNNVFFRYAMVVLLSLAMLVAYFPVLGDSIYAEEQGGDGAYYALPGEGDGGFVAADEALTEEGVDAAVQQQDEANGVIAGDEVNVTEEAADVSRLETDALPAEMVGSYGLAGADVQLKGVGSAEDGVVSAAAAGDTYGVDVDVDKDGIATVYAYVGIDGLYFTELYVDDTYEADVEGETVIDGLTINMKDYPVGYHTVKIYLGGSDEIDGLFLYFDHVPTYIFDKPSLNLSDIYTGHNYFNLSDDYNYYSYDEDCGTYFDFKKSGGAWNQGYGPVGYKESVKKSGLAAAKQYMLRMYFAKVTQYTPPRSINDTEDPPTETVLFKGPYSKTVNFKTGYKKTPVKKIKAKAVKTWCHKIKVRRLSNKIYWRYGYAGYGPYRKVLGYKTYKYWYTKVKVTVKMKKKPGVAGIYIGNKKAGGNKKTYSKKFVLSGKKKGHKIKVSVYSYMSKTYGGWSGRTLKKVKIH